MESVLLYFKSINDLEMFSLTLNTKRTHLISVFIVLAENSCTNGKKLHCAYTNIYIYIIYIYTYMVTEIQKATLSFAVKI